MVFWQYRELGQGAHLSSLGEAFNVFEISGSKWAHHCASFFYAKKAAVCCCPARQKIPCRDSNELSLHLNARDICPTQILATLLLQYHINLLYPQIQQIPDISIWKMSFSGHRDSSDQNMNAKSIA